MMRLWLFLFFALLAGPAAADPITALVSVVTAFVGGGATFAALASALLRGLVKAGISLLVAKLRQRKQKQPGIQSTHTTSGGTEPQATILGRFATRGHVIYQNSHGDNNKWLVHVIELGDLPGATLRRLIIDGEYSEIGAPDANGNCPIETKARDGNVYGYLRYYDGTQTAADPTLVENYSGDEERPWTVDHILTGTCYALLQFHRKDDVYPGGVPSYAFEMDGPPLYDPRQDSTAGGVGAQRFNAPSTWAQTTNLMVIAYNVMRGLRLPDGRVWGGAAESAEDLPYAEWAAAMEACDLAVGPNNRAQFQGGFEVQFEDEPADFLEELFSAANAQIVELGGYWFPLVGSAMGSSAEVTGDDLLVSEAWTHDPFPGLENTFNAVTITYTNPASLWEASTLETIVMDDWVTEDGRQKLFELRLPMVFRAAQARQLARALLQENRRFRSHRLPLPGEYAHLRPLQNMTLTLPDFGYTSKTFRITEVAYDLLTLNVSLSLRETDPADFDVDPTLELPDVPNVTGPVIPTDAGVVGFAVVGEEVSNGTGAPRAPAIRIVWNAGLADTCEALAFETRIAGRTDADTFSTSEVSAGTYRHQPVLPNANYEVRAKAIARRRRTSWSAWLPVTTPDVRVTPDLLDDATWDAISDDAAAVASGLLDDYTVNVIAPIAGSIEPIQRDLELRAVEQRTVAEAVAMIGDRVLWAVTQLADVDGRLADAGIVTDPETGTVRIYAVEQEAERISEAEIRLNAAEGLLSLSATQAWVNEQISQAVLDPSQIPLLADLQLRVNDVRVDLNAAEAALALAASQTEVDGLGVRLSTAEADLDAVNAAIELKAEQSQFDALNGRVQTAEIQIQALDGPAITQTVADTRHLLSAADGAADQTLASLLQAHQDGERVRQDIAYATQDLRARIDEDREAEASRSVALGVSIDNATALLEQESLVRASTDQALASDMTALDARLDGAEDDLAAQSFAQSELTARVTSAEGAITSQSQSLVSLTARIGDAEDDLADQATAVSSLTARMTSAEGVNTSQAQSLISLTSRIGDAEDDLAGQASALGSLTARVTSAEGVNTSQAQSLTSLTSRIGDAEDDLAGQASALGSLTTRVTSAEGVNTSQAQSLTSLTSRIGAAEDDASDQASALNSLSATVSEIDGDVSAQAQSIASLSTALGNNVSTVETISESVDGMLGRHMLRVNVNGVATGMVIAAEAGDGGAVQSSIAFAADAFTISAPNGNGAATPFAVYTSGRTLGGIYYPPGVYLESAYIGRAAIGRGQITDTLQSDDYAQDSDGRPTNGIKIEFDTGRIKAANVVISRPLKIASGSFTVPGTFSHGSQFSFINTGIRVGKEDVWSASKVALVASAAITSTATAVGGLDGDNRFWALDTAIQPGARWFGYGGSRAEPDIQWARDPATTFKPWWASGGDQRLFLKIRLDAIGVEFTTPTIEWSVFEVT